MKELTDEQLKILGVEMSNALNSWGNVWEQGMKGLRLDSKEYKEICKAGNAMQSAYGKLRTIAENRNWSGEELKSIFSAGYRGFS